MKFDLYLNLTSPNSKTNKEIGFSLSLSLKSLNNHSYTSADNTTIAFSNVKNKKSPSGFILPPQHDKISVYDVLCHVTNLVRI